MDARRRASAGSLSREMHQPLVAAEGQVANEAAHDAERARSCGSHDEAQRIVYEVSVRFIDCFVCACRRAPADTHFARLQVMSGGAVSGAAAASQAPRRSWTHRCGTVVEIAIIVVILVNMVYVMLDAEQIEDAGSMKEREPKTLDDFMDYFVSFVRSLSSSLSSCSIPRAFIFSPQPYIPLLIAGATVICRRFSRWFSSRLSMACGSGRALWTTSTPAGAAG